MVNISESAKDELVSGRGFKFVPSLATNQTLCQFFVMDQPPPLKEVKIFRPDKIKVRFDTLEFADICYLLPELTDKMRHVLNTAYRAVRDRQTGSWRLPGTRRARTTQIDGGQWFDRARASACRAPNRDCGRCSDARGVPETISEIGWGLELRAAGS